MKIQMKINFKIIFFILFSTFVYSEDINHSLNLALKDSLVDISKIDSKFQNQPEYMFLNALIDTDGESAKSKFIEFQNKYPSHKFADNAVFEIGSYFYSKGWHLKGLYAIFIGFIFASSTIWNINLNFLQSFAWIIGAIISFITYYLLASK